MIKSTFLIIINLLIVIIYSSIARCEFHSSPRPLNIILNESSVVIVGRLTSYRAADNPSKKQRDALEFLFGTNQEKKAGIYSFNVVKKIKGSCDSSLTLNLPRVNSQMYMDAKISLKSEGIFLLCLKKDNKGNYLPTDAENPFIPLGDSEYIKKSLSDSQIGVNFTVVSLLIDSLYSSDLRPFIAFSLSVFNDPRIPGAVTPHLKDPNLYVQDGVLACMARNQQPEAIPLIINLFHRESLIFGRSVFEMENYRTKRAVPALNRAVYDRSVAVRLTATGALRNICDDSSIPFLMLALNDPEVAVAYNAYAGLHGIIPSLGRAKIVPDFEKNRRAETDLLLAWWRDELSEKHPRPKSPGTRAVVAN